MGCSVVTVGSAGCMISGWSISKFLRHHYRAGEKMFVDFAGQTVRIVDPVTGEVWQAPVFVATLGASSYTGRIEPACTERREPSPAPPCGDEWDVPSGQTP